MMRLRDAKYFPFGQMRSFCRRARVRPLKPVAHSTWWRGVAGRIPILGVCLGHQTIASALGGSVVRADEPMHGRASGIEHTGEGLFAGLPNPLVVGRYHSLIVEEASLPSDLRVTARTSDGTVMALEYRRWPVFGVQFHPESILTECGHA